MGRDLPTYGYDLAPTDDTYQTIIAAGTDDADDAYNYIIVQCATKDCIVSIDNGTTESIRVQAGKEPTKVPFPPRIGAIKAKNAAAGENYASLYIIAGYEDR